jgi:hypothetical protein
MIFNAYSVFLAVNASLCCLNNVSGVHLVQVSLLLIGQQGLGHFFREQPWLLIGRRTVHVVRQCQRKMSNAAPTTHGAIQAEANSLLLHNFTPLVISGKDKNKQLTILSQCKLAYVNGCVNSEEHQRIKSQAQS